MSNKTESKKEKGSITRKIVMGALIGGGFGVYLRLLNAIGILGRPVGSIVVLAILGALSGAIIGILLGVARGNTADDHSYHNNNQPLRKAFKNISHNTRMQLREEQLEISKELVKMADVTSHKEVITEDKTITVPVTREELVIEKRNLINKTSDTDNEPTVIMRIPISEEQVEVVKNPVKLEDVSIYTNEYQGTEHIEETIKKETAHVETTGNATVVDEDAEENL
jgi:uncharacterized protein (TIGR02271 family)